MQIRFLLIIPVLFFFSNLFSQPPSVEKLEKARLHFNEGVRYGINEQFEASLESFNRAIEYNPLFAEAFLYKGLAQIELGQYREAVRNLTISIELDPAFSDQALYFRGVSRLYLDEFFEALNDLDIAIHLNPDYAAYFQRGRVHHKLGNFERSMQDFEIALRLNPDFYEARLYRGIVHYHMGNAPLALVEFETLRDKLPDNILLEQYILLAGEYDKESTQKPDNQTEIREIRFADFYRRVDDNEEEEKRQTEEISNDQPTQNEKRDEIQPDEEPVQESFVSTSPEVPKLIEVLKSGTYNHLLVAQNPTGFGVQVASYSNSLNLLNLAEAYHVKYQVPVFINVSQVNGRTLYKLILGSFSDRAEAEKFRDKMRKGDFADSFLVIFENL